MLRGAASAGAASAASSQTAVSSVTGAGMLNMAVSGAAPLLPFAPKNAVPAQIAAAATAASAP